MKNWFSSPFTIVVLLCMLGIFPASAQEKFDVKSVIAPPIQAMPAPQIWEGEGKNIGELNIPVWTSKEIVKQHVRQGFALIHAQWDVEAYRHFAAALEHEPDCLMAYCGIVMSLLNPQHEWKEYRAKAINRMMSLAEHKSGEGEDAGFVYPANERGYAIAIGSLVANGLEAGALSFKLLAEKYPNDLQLALLAPFFNRGKYDVFGSSDDKQDRAVKAVKDLLEKNPDNPLVRNFYVMMLVEAPANAVDQKTEVLPYAKQLVELGGKNFPCWQMLLGYSAWRSGELELARDAYERAASLYEVWKEESKADISECDGLIRAYSFLTVIYNQLGDTKKLGKSLVNLNKASQAREGSAIHAIHTWSHQMVISNMFFGEGGKEAVKNAIKQLPEIDRKDKNKESHNLMIKGYQAFGLALSNLLENKEETSMRMAMILQKTIGELIAKRDEIKDELYYSQYLIMLQNLRVYQAELAAVISGEEGAYNAYQEAIDLQLLPTRYYPPNILYPMEYKLAKFYEKKGDLKKARETYRLALERMPSHPESKAAYKKLMGLLE